VVEEIDHAKLADARDHRFVQRLGDDFDGVGDAGGVGERYGQGRAGTN
jgi:hypothetical protein